MFKVSQPRRKEPGGFSLTELMIAVAILMVFMAIFPPVLMNVTASIQLRYSATDLSGLIQKARIEAVRKNTFYSIEQGTITSNSAVYFADLQKNDTLAQGDPLVQMGNNVSVTFGSGSGAPQETAFIASFGFPVDASGVLPKFNARGLPCLPNVANTLCPQSGQGFVYFLSRPNTFGTKWAAVVVTPSGRVQAWSYNGNWTQL